MAPGVIAVRDSEAPNGPKLLISRDEFAAMVASLKR
ncbi:DUF397 domain-containing protein [Actinomadura sp. GTD37]